MIKVAKNVLRSPDFKTAVVKLAAHKDYPTKVFYKIMRVIDLLDKEGLKAHNEWVALLKKYVPVDGKGNFTLNENRDGYSYLEGVDPQAAKDAIEAWGREEVEIRGEVVWEKFNLEELRPAGLSPVDAIALSSLIQYVEPTE